jgi:hypothetical protein
MWQRPFGCGVRRRATGVAALLCLLLSGAAVAGEKPLCTSADEVFEGRWNLSEATAAAPERYCPATTVALSADLQRKHICNGTRAYHVARFAHSSCHVRTAQRSLQLLSQRCAARRTVTFVGDSITKQLYFAFRCEAERAEVGSLSAKLVDSRWLWSVPCPADCSVEDKRATCISCKQGGSMADEASWPEHVPDDTAVLVLGTGLWYNPAKGVPEGDAAYADTLAALLPVLQSVASRGVLILWVDIPPCVRLCDSYDHHTIPAKNAAAAAKLAAVPNLVYLNTSRATAYRKLQQPDVVADGPGGVHWCSPGPHSVTAFLTAQLLHVMVASNACARA